MRTGFVNGRPSDSSAGLPADERERVHENVRLLEQISEACRRGDADTVRTLASLLA